MLQKTVPLAPTRSRNRTRPTSSKFWSPEDDALLLSLVEKKEDWGRIALQFPGRTIKQVLSHWKKVADPKIVRGSWTFEEDQKILMWVSACGPCNWSKLADQMPGRIAKQCRERWCNHLDPSINHAQWTEEEDRIIIEKIRQVGTKWADIARLLPGRTDNSVKNRWNSTLRRRKIVDVNNQPPIICENRPEQKIVPIINSIIENRPLLNALLHRKLELNVQ